MAYHRLAKRKARKYGLDPKVFERQIQQESGFQAHIGSQAGAQGIAQIMPATARGWGVDPNKPREALDAAAKNMASYVKKYGGYENALRAYNAGPGAIQASKGYSETNNYVKTILGGKDPGKLNQPDEEDDGGGDGRPGRRGRAARVNTTVTRTPGVSNRAARGQLVASFLEDKDSDVLDFATQLKALKDIPGTSSTSRTRTPGRAGVRATSPDGGGGGGGGGDGLAAMATRRANAFEKKGFSYAWGGGHGAKLARRKDFVPVDCSGAVSAVLKMDPRVSGQFASWGKAGDGGNRGVTIYSNPHHVLMKINGRFFGTSGSNPGGGAGWIPSSAVSGDYLKGFTARHRKA